MFLIQNQKLSQPETTTRILCARAQEKTRWQPSVAVLVLLLLTGMILFAFFMYLNTELLKLCHLDLIAARFLGGCAFSNHANKGAIAFLVFCLVALSFSCLSHRIGLALKWAISIRVWLLFQEIWPLSYRMENHPQPILLWWPPFYFNDAVSQSMLGITRAMHHAVSQFTRGDMSLHIPGTCSRNIFMCVQMLWFCPCYMSPQCALHTFLSLQHVAATCLCNMTPRVWPP